MPNTGIDILARGTASASYGPSPVGPVWPQRHPAPPKHQTHEAYIQAVARVAVAHLALKSPNEALRVSRVKLVYGVGSYRGARGVTYFEAWQGKHSGRDMRVDFLEVCAIGESSNIQLAGTTIHELAHALAGPCGHDKSWREACARLGLIRADAAGQDYTPADFHPAVWGAIEALDTPTDGAPGRGSVDPGFGLPTPKIKGCQVGIGARGGKSRGVGSGSRLRLWQCQCDKPVKVRVASDTFDATCNACGETFVLVDKSGKSKDQV